MADATTVVEGKIKFREGKKWKSRWCVLRKLSPVADRLQVTLYKDVSEFKQESKPKSVFTLDGYFGLDAGFDFDRESHVMAIICQKIVHLMAFEFRENMIQFEIKIRQSLGEEHQFPVKVVKAPSNCRLPKEQIRLVIHDTKFCLLSHSPPKVLLTWHIEDLHRCGAKEGKFCFKGGTRCGKGSGLFALQSEQAEDIADIIELASTGKMSNCHRKVKNRSSQIDLGSHLIADLSSLPSSSSHYHHHHPPIEARVQNPGGLPVTLSCCHNSQTGSAESEDWSWYKRHSVSVMDHRRIAALREQGLPENREQLITGIYDIPPSHGWGLKDCSIQENLEEPNYSYPSSDLQVQGGPNISCSTNKDITPFTNSISSIDCASYKRIRPRIKETNNDQSQLQREQLEMAKKRQSANTEVLNYSIPGSQYGNNRAKGERDISEHQETLQRLRKQEYDLQREMLLLDEILQDCAAKSQELTCSPERNIKMLETGNHHHHHQSVPKYPMENLSGPLRLSTETSSMPSEQDFQIISGNITSSPSTLGKINLPKRNKAIALRLNTSMPEGTPVSPLFHAKLNNIPHSSRLNAPLPYVNLAQYDDESYSHVHFPGSADCVPVARETSMQGLTPAYGKKWRGHGGSLSNLDVPVSASSLINLSQVTKEQAAMQRQQLRGQSLFERASRLIPRKKDMGLRKDNASLQNEQTEILVVRMDSSNAVENKPCHSSQRSLDATKSSSDLVSILTKDSYGHMMDGSQNSHDKIYENLPVVKINDTQAPELPPKGPALLKKLRAAAQFAKTGPQVPYTHNVRSTGSKFQTFDAHPVGDNNRTSPDEARDLGPQRSQQTKPAAEDNYLLMGSPKLTHKSPSGLEQPTGTLKVMDTNIRIPTQFGNHSVRSDYLDMENGAEWESYLEDEIYLDIETVNPRQPKDLYISEADLVKQDGPLPTSVETEKGESTYIEMASVSNRRSIVLQGPEPSEAALGEIARTVATTSPPPPHPNKPVPLKVRHNSDSGLPSQQQNTFDVANKHVVDTARPKKGKSPMKVYSKIKTQNKQNHPGTEHPTPFPNLIEFTKKMSDSRSTYVNTYVDATSKNLLPGEPVVSRDVLLPQEPQKEGFLARFKRRSSRDKGSGQIQEKASNNDAKSRCSVLERSMSEHESSKAVKDEKSLKLKIGRRRSSSFPNRLSYQESVDISGGPLKHTDSSSSSFSCESTKPREECRPPGHSESLSSVHDFSDDSDLSPLLRRGNKKPTASKTMTILHVQSNDHPSHHPYLDSSKSVPQFPDHLVQMSQTDDEKLFEMSQKKEFQKQPMVYCKSSLFELKQDGKDSSQDKASNLSDLKRQTVSKIPPGAPKSLCFGNPSILKSPRMPDSSSLDHMHENLKDSSATSFLTVTDNTEDTPPSLPPKTRAYQSLLSPVLEASPPIAPTPEPIYVEMDEVPNMVIDNTRKEVDAALSTLQIQPIGEDEKENVWLTNSNFDSKAGRFSDPNEENLEQPNCSTLTIPVSVTAEENVTLEDMVDGSNNAHSSSITSLSWTMFQALKARADTPESGSECTSPAKSILRPRSGSEYIVVKRVSPPCVDGSGVSYSPSPSHNSDFDIGFCCNHNYHHQQQHHHHHHRLHGQCQIHSEPPLPHCAALSCNSLTLCSRSPGQTPQRSPSFSSVADTTHSYMSLLCDPWEKESSRSSHQRLGATNDKTDTALSSPASSPRLIVSHSTISPSLLKETLKKSSHSATTEDSVFFPMDMPFSVSPPSSPYLQHQTFQIMPSVHENYPTYVNQDFIFKYTQPSPTTRTPSFSSSHSSTSPIRAGVQSLKSLLFKDSSKHISASDSVNSAHADVKRSRSRHSESDANKFEKHMLSLSSKTDHCSTLPPSLQRVKGNGNGENPLLTLTLPPEDTHISQQSKVHQKEYDKFAHSSIISRRRLQCSEPEKYVNDSASVIDSKKNSVENTYGSNGDLPLSLQVPPVKSSGYKNIDTFNAVAAIASSHVKVPVTGEFRSPVPLPPYDSESQKALPEDALPDTNSHHTVINVSAHKYSGSPNLSHPVSASMLHASSPPPPLPRPRLPSPMISPSPPLPPVFPSDLSDSPPSYYAPSPPCADVPPPLPVRKPLMPLCHSVMQSPPPESEHASDSSEEEAELNYIEVDMTKSPSEPPPQPPLGFSRRSKRVKRKKEPAELRYAIIDLRATQALQQTRQEHAQARDYSMRKSPSHLSRINSAPSSSKRKPLSLVPRERKLSSGSLDSC